MSEIHLLQGDCLTLMRDMPDNSFDLVLTDPPYGIGVTKMTLGNGKNKIYRGSSEWDVAPSREVLDEIRRVSKVQIIWGGNYFSDNLPASRCWLVWNKGTGANSFADCELSWTSLDSVVKMYTISWVGANAKDTPERLHPTQKPVTLMEWCIRLADLSDGAKVLDPFMGSGSTGVACIKLNCDFMGIERDPKYFAIAERRITDAQLQMVMPLSFQDASQ